ncbi:MULTISPECIES: TetR/AcrR family transcriptional regulator [Streptomyces]|uniref:TetR/AcrR family transcriptional regulator n=1 Tax=Streptomyces TaxID=1883 RepID=UPI001D152A71|nr:MULTISPECIES: TetR/AcrR family transcriptional regulator [Streptomyces]MCC3650788.1 TetR/AcrR family transcriptional regulator [Streptomyces sp. S07_1.15]WSQ74350.1 TetR/AcrR family transcriptional regulator [Streptomyces xinghaiensis]
MTKGSGGKTGYHHGDLRNALIGAAVELAVEGGPERVVLREAARRVGVSPTAAYRHFSGHGDLLWQVKARGQQALAAFMLEAVREVPPFPDPGEEAERRLAAIGRGYVRFAVENPGLYRTAFRRIPADAPGADGVRAAFTGSAPPGDEPRYSAFRVLTDTLDAAVAAGRMAPAARPGAEIAAWSAVHGLAQLLLDGPLSGLPAGQWEALTDRTVRMVVAGLFG